MLYFLIKTIKGNIMNKFISSLTAVSFLIVSSLYAQKADSENLTKLYIASFDRAPDSTGLEYWLTQSNLSLEDIATSFFEQEEMQEKYPLGSNNSEYVNAVYNNLFQHSPDAGGESYWVKELDESSISLSEFTLAVVNGAIGDDATILDNKTTVGLEFVASGSNNIEMSKNIMRNITANPQTLESVLTQIENIDVNSTYYQANASLTLDSYPKDELSEDQKYSLAYMWHEEKLAKEIYLELNKVYPSNQLEKIANNSEVKHIELVENLVEFYDINITNIADYEINYSASELENMAVGKFAIPEIESLYNLLYDKGIASQQASYEVGCMVEVTDIDDLDKFLASSGTNQALIDTFTILRDGSYEHYWAFDAGLKSLGVVDGCCSLSSEYCHLEYPQSDKGTKGKR